MSQVDSSEVIIKQSYTIINKDLQQIQNILQMIILFLNLHKNDQNGALKFQRYYNSVTKILRQSIYYGTQYQQYIRNRDNIQDFLYDQYQRNSKIKSKQKFKSVAYVFIEGPTNLSPWSVSLNNVSLLIRNCIKENKKVHFNGFGHTAIYYYLSTGFDKDYYISRKGVKITGKQDYFHEQQTGDLYNHGKRVCNSGIQILTNSNKVFQTKSVQALQKGAVLATKFHYLAFNSKNGDSLIKNIIFPFTFYQKHKVFCTPLNITRANVNVLVQTQAKNPIVFTSGESLSTHLLCPETIKILANWITNGQQVKPFRQILVQNESIPDIAFDNIISLKNSKNCRSLLSNLGTNKSSLQRPQTANSYKSKYTFEKPVVRCSSPYQTLDHIKIVEDQLNKQKILGRSRMNFKSQMYKNEIKNYVQRTPSRPPTAHNFRQINKSKWMDKKTFFVT